MKIMKKVLFIHVPKTGGTSIASFLEMNNMDPWKRQYPARHDPYHFMEKVNNITSDVFSFSVVRNPYTRTYSYYKHFNYQNQTNVSFVEFLGYVKDKLYFPKTPMIPFSQSFYILDCDKKISLSKIYRFENLSEFEIDFNTNLPYLRKGGYNKEDYLKDYTQETIGMVKEIYKHDFINLNYTDNFHESIR
jgi:hypothetical protein